VDGVLKALNARGVMCDVRRPNVMRIAPTPLYNSFSDVFEFVTILKDALASCDA
jgi:kynureninase